MSIIGWLILGLTTGFVASKVVNKSGEGLVIDIVLGVVGAVVGGFLFSLIGAAPVTGFNIYGTVARLGVGRPVGYFRVCSLAEGGCVAWMLRLVKIGAEGEGPCADIMEIRRPDDLVDIANVGLTLAEAKLLLAGVQREIVAAQARGHAVRRPECPRCDGVCRVKDYRDHAVATLFGEVTVRLPRFRCAACGGIEAGIAWPVHCRSTPELDRLEAHLCALMTYRTAADVLAQMFPVSAGKHFETLRRHTLKVGETLRNCPLTQPETEVDPIRWTGIGVS